jgi:hypothetical protein
MMTAMRKSDLYALLALLLLLVCFVIPSIAFYKVPEKIAKNDIESIPGYVYSMWNLYQTGRYVSPYTPDGAAGDLKKMIDRKGEIGTMSVPVWFVSLEAPNYPVEAFPNGIPVYFHFDGYSGDVHEMNTINHFIGMYPMEAGAQLEKSISPFLLLFVALMMILFIMYHGKWSQILLLPSLLIPFIFFAVYAGWLYWYGHNLQEWGMFKVKPFMPTALGDGKVAQFTTHSYPTTGFYILLVISVLSLLGIFARSKGLKQNG